MNNSTENLDTTSGAVVYYILAANVAFLTFYLFFITIFINHSKHLSTSCYIFIKFLCMADICILISLLLVNITYNGIITNDATFLSYMRLCSDLFGDGFGYFPTLFVNILIGFNRFTAIVYYARYNSIFTRRFSNVSIIIVFMLGIFFASLYFVYPDEEYYAQQDGIATIVTLVITFSCYILATIASYYRVKMSSIASDAKKQLKQERKMLLQVTVIAVNLLLQEVIYLSTSSDLDYDPIFSFIYIMYSGSNPFIFLIFDRKIRLYFMKNVQTYCKFLPPTRVKDVRPTERPMTLMVNYNAT